MPIQPQRASVQGIIKDAPTKMRHKGRSIMHWRFTPYAIPLIIATIISAWLVLVAWRRRSTPGAIPFGLLMLGVGEWSLTYAVELGSTGLPTVLFWDNLTWVGAVIGPAAWPAFGLQYTWLE